MRNSVNLACVCSGERMRMSHNCARAACSWDQMCERKNSRNSLVTCVASDAVKDAPCWQFVREEFAGQAMHAISVNIS